MGIWRYGVMVTGVGEKHKSPRRWRKQCNGGFTAPGREPGCGLIVSGSGCGVPSRAFRRETVGHWHGSGREPAP